MCWQHLAPLSCPSPQKSQFKPRRPSPPEQNLQEDTYLRRVLGRDLTLGQPVAHGDGDKPLAKRGRRVRAFLESLRTVQGHVKGEQGLPGQALPVWDRGLPTVPAAPSPCCLVPVCVPSLLPQLALPPSLHIPRGCGTCAPHAGSQILPAAQAGGCRSLLVASPGWWLPQQGQGLDVTPWGRTEPCPHHQQVAACTV